MKVLLLTTHLNMGGIGIYTVNLARYLKKEGVDVCIATSGGDLLPRLASSDIPIKRVDIKTKAEFGLKMWKSLPQLVKLIREEKIDIVHAQTRVAQVAASILRMLTEVKVVTTCHGFFKHTRLSRKIFPCWGDKAIAISKSVKDHLVADLGVSSDKVDLVYNGIELEKYVSFYPEKDEDLLKSLSLASSSYIIGTVGRLSPVKGYRFLITAMRKIADSKAGVKLLMVGDGPEKEALLKQIDSLGLQENVVITSGNAPLEKYMSLIDIFCMPSVHEGLGLSLMEAMASGRACVASDIGGLSELIVNDFDGVLVKSEDPKAIGEAVLSLLNDDEKRKQFSWNARVKASKEFSIEKSVKETIKVYESVL